MKPMTQAVAIAAGMAAAPRWPTPSPTTSARLAKRCTKWPAAPRRPWPTSTAWSSTTPAERANKQTRRRSLSRLHRRVCFWGAFGGKRRPRGAVPGQGRPALCRAGLSGERSPGRGRYRMRTRMTEPAAASLPARAGSRLPVTSIMV